MKIALASGKGGTGKTTLSVALALASADPVQLLDCDVEEPNSHLFLNTKDTEKRGVTTPVPVIDQDACTHCGACARFCEFNALAALPSKTMVFADLCHGCGGCMRICPEHAISEEGKSIGTVSIETQDHITFIQGLMNIGVAMAPPVIRAVKDHIDPNKTVIIDCPPGTSCSLITAVTGVDYAILVTEPTPFGLHDLSLAVETMRVLNIPFGVAINRSDSGDNRVVKYCESENIPVLLEIPESRNVAEAYSRGKSLIDALPEMKPALQSMMTRIEQLTQGSTK